MAQAHNLIELNITRSNLPQYYLDANTADVFFICSDGLETDENVMKETVPAHKVILASVSKVFQAMFHGQLAEKNEIVITDVTAGALKQFLHLFYNKEVICSIAHVHEVMYLAEKYDVPDWSLACCKLIIQRGHECFKTTNFLYCSQTILRTIVQSIYLKGEGEILFKACMDWAENACNMLELDSGNMENRRKMIGGCFDLIEFASIKQSVIIEYLENYQSLFKTNELGYILRLISEKVTTHNDLENRWPAFVSKATETMELEKGTPYRMEFQAEQRCLLYNIAFSIQGGEFRTEPYLVASIGKTDLNNDKKTKVFVGTLLLKDKITNVGFDLLSTPLPDIIVIDAKTTYVIEITPFQNMKIDCFGTDFQYYEDAAKCRLHFHGLNFALLNISAI